MRTDHINAIELTEDLLGRPIEATVMFTEVNAKIANTSVMIDGERREISEADTITISGTIMGVQSAMNAARAAKIVQVRVHSYNGEFREFRDHEFVWGSHIVVEITDPLDESHEDGSESTMGDDMRAMFADDDSDEAEDSEPGLSINADMPDPESDGMTCDGPDSCIANATRAGFVPDGNGGVDKVLVCEFHSYRWGSLLGSWPIENDSEYGVPHGVAGLDIGRCEEYRTSGTMTRGDYDSVVAGIIANKVAVSTGEVRLAKSTDTPPRPTYVGLFSNA